jgi:XTP/dITP diphosphohydrolase
LIRKDLKARMKKLVLASGNQGKLAEFKALFAKLAIEVLPLSDFGVESPEETGLSFIENAILKARHASKATGLPALADDSGLAIDALNGAPGIYSARYAGVGVTDADNIDKALKSLAGVPEAQRGARFHCVLALMQHAEDPMPLIAHGAWSGRILSARVGDGGFGYDPVFYVPEKDCAAAQLSKDEKNAISHRGKAIAELLNVMHGA